jgi:dihydrofolate reductase
MTPQPITPQPMTPQPITQSGLTIVLVAVVSLDGCLTKHDEPGASGWASADDQDHFRATLATCDASIMGSATYLEAREQITANLTAKRRRIVMTRSPQRFINDGAPRRLEFTSETPTEIVYRLRADGHHRCAILGGGQIYSLFLAAGLVDEMLMTIEPRVFGTGIRFAGINDPIDPQFRLTEVSRLGTDTVLLTLQRAETSLP